MNLVTRNPFAVLTELQRDMNRIFDNRLFPTAGSDNTTTFNSSDWLPSVDIHEDNDGYHVSVDLPGVKPEEIEVTAHNNVLSIRGKREITNDNKELKRSERIFGSFIREFSMPENADLENVRAQSEHGVLQIVVPKTPKSEPKRITVQNNAPQISH